VTFDEGKTMSWEQAVDLALGKTPDNQSAVN
jgi:hypothetical protein